MTSDPNQCPLDVPAQQRNLRLFAACTAMQYLAAPVLYVGVTQAALCDKLNASTRVANLPGTLFFAMTAVPALIAWLSPRVSVLRRNLAICYAVTGTVLGLTAIVVLSPLPDPIKIGMVIIQGGVSGAAMPTAIALLWEAVCRGSDLSRRGVALGLAFGAGPLFAVVGSMAQTALIGGKFFGLTLPGIAYPASFVVLFAAGVPVMALAVMLSLKFTIPPVDNEPQREPASAVMGLLIGVVAMMTALGLIQAAGMLSTPALAYLSVVPAAIAVAGLVYHFRAIFSRRVLLLATLVTVLVYVGNTIPSNMNLYSKVALDDEPAKYAGVQNVLRFAFKVVAGTLLGWMLTRTNPRAGLLTTAAIFLVAQVWAMFATGQWYLLAFGIYGAGELVGVYAPNYIASACRPHEVRKNMALATMLMAPAAPAGYLFGWIVDTARSEQWTAFGASGEALGFRLSFAVCALFIVAGIALAALTLPKTPSTE